MNDPELHSVLPRIRKLPLFVAILVFILICLWQITSFQHSLKWDAIDITLPWRIFTAECLLNGIWPWWNPFQFHGFAHGSIPETWYPPGIFLGLLNGYSLYDLNLEYLFHLLVASAGYYRLAKHLGIEWRITCLGALIFPLSGFFIGNAQHMGWIISGAWLPHVLVSFDRFCKDYHWHDAIAFCLAFFMLITGGYIAYSIVCLYLLAALFIMNLWRSKSNIKLFFLHRWFRFSLLAAGVSSVVIASLWQLRNLIDRGIGLRETEVTEGSFYFKHLISLVYPFASVHEYPQFWHADQSMISVYVTLPLLFLLAYGLRQFKYITYKHWWIITLFFLLLSLGDELPFRKLLNVLPLFELFRFPSLFRYFFILGLLLIASRILQDLMHQPISSRFRMMRRAALLIAVLSFVAFAGIAVIDPPSVESVLQLKIRSIEAAVAFQSLIYLLLYGGVFLLSIIRNSWLPLAFILAFLGELFTSTQLTGRVSVFASEDFGTLNHCINQLPKGFPLPPLSEVLKSNADRSLQVGSIYRNTNTLYKRIGWDGYTPFQYSKFISWEKTAFYPKNLDQPFLYLSTLRAPDPANNIYYSSPEQELTRTIAILSFLPNEINLEVNVAAPKLLVLNQNTHPSWRVSVNGEEAPIKLVDGNLPGVILPEGSHLVKFWFEPGTLLNGLLISGILFVVVFGVWLHLQLGLLPSIIVMVLLTAKGLFTVFYPEGNVVFDQEARRGAVYVNALDQMQTEVYFDADRLLDEHDLPRFRGWIFNAQDTITYWSRKSCLPVESQILQVLEQYYSVTGISVIGQYQGLHCIRHTRAQWAVESSNYFELSPVHWDKLDQSIEVESDGNRCQNMGGHPFSSTFRYNFAELEGSLSLIDFSFLVKSDGDASGAKIVFSIRDDNDSEIHRKDFNFTNRNPLNLQEWSTIQVTSEIPSDLAGAEHLQVYIWNPERTQFLIDNLEVKLQVDLRTFKE